MDTLRVSHAFLCVDAFVDEKRVGGHGTFMRVAVETPCKDVLAQFLKSHAPDYSPLHDSTNVILSCQVLANETISGRTAGDLITLRDGTVFLDFPLSMAMAEVPTKKFTFRCTRPAEDRRPRSD